MTRHFSSQVSWLFVAVTVFACGNICEGAIRRVNPDSTCCTGCDGSNWTNKAYHTLTQAIAASSNGDEIWVRGSATGTTYYPDQQLWVEMPECGVYQTGNRSATFNISSPALSLYGGFAGTETSRSQRNWTVNLTILSGDIDVDGLLDAQNSYHVVTYSTDNAVAVLDGFTVTGGYANGANPDDQGGGFTIRKTGTPCLTGGPVIRNCTFRENHAGNHGGAINEHGTSTIIANCIFESNDAGDHGGALSIETGDTQVSGSQFSYNDVPSGSGKGGAVWASHRSECDSSVSLPRFTNCTFTSNTCGGPGAAVWTEFNTPTFTGCTFDGNQCEGYGCALYTLTIGTASSHGQFTDCVVKNCSNSPPGDFVVGSAGIFAADSFLTITRARVYDNTATANLVEYAPVFVYNGTTTIVDSLIYDNRGTRVNQPPNGLTDRGGGVFAIASTASMTLTISGCTIANNYSLLGGGIRIEEAGGNSAIASISNSIIWDNTAPQISPGPGTTVAVSYSDVEGGWGTCGSYSSRTCTTGPHNHRTCDNGNIDSDPCFLDAACDADLDAYEIDATSPCSNAGDPLTTCAGPTASCGRKGRTGTTTDGDVDMGAFEVPCGGSVLCKCSPWTTCDNGRCVQCLTDAQCGPYCYCDSLGTCQCN